MHLRRTYQNGLALHVWFAATLQLLSDWSHTAATLGYWPGSCLWTNQKEVVKLLQTKHEVLPHLVGTCTAFDIVDCQPMYLPTALQSTLAVVKITTLFSRYIALGATT